MFFSSWSSITRSIHPELELDVKQVRWQQVHPQQRMRMASDDATLFGTWSHLGLRT
jgi:hypothetical protein